MHHSRITLLLVAGMILTISASASALAGQPQDPAQVQEPDQPPHYAPVHITVTLPDDFDPETPEYIVRVSPWRVVVDRDSAGVVWVCHLSDVLTDCEITFAGQSADHFVPEGEERTERGKEMKMIVNPDIVTREWGNEDNKHSLSGAYSIHIFIQDGPVLNIDPDHSIDPRG